MKPQKNVLLPLLVIVIILLFAFVAYAWFSATNGGTNKTYYLEADVKIVPVWVGSPSIEIVNVKSGESWFPFTIQPIKEFCILGACGGTNIMVSIENKTINLGSWSTGIASGPILRHFTFNGLTLGTKSIHITVLGDNSEIIAEKDVSVVIG